MSCSSILYDLCLSQPFTFTPPNCHFFSPTLGLIITHFFSLPPLLPLLQILEDLDEQIYCIHLQEEALQRRLNGMSVGDVLARYSREEGVDCPIGWNGAHHTGIN